jgi:membrane protein
MLINKKTFERYKKFITEDIWNVDTALLPLKKRFGFSSIRVLIILFKGFQKDNCTMQAAALTNITLMSMVPMMAFMFAIAKGLQFNDDLEKIISEKFANNPGILEVLTNLFDMIQNTNFKALGSIGVILLLWTVISVMSKIENSFNTIWGISKPREFFNKCKEYLVTVMLVPFALLATASINTALRNGGVAQKVIGFLGDYSIIYDAFLWIVSPCLVALAFTYLYKFIPNTKVKFLPAFFAALITTFLWQFTQWVFVKFQIGVSNYSQIYGTFSAIPLFLAWLYTSWTLILFGAELSFAIQNQATFENESRSDKVSTRTLLSISLCLTKSLSRNFIKGEEWKASIFFSRNSIPSRLGNKALDLLCEGNIIKCVHRKETIFLPSRDLTNMTLWDVYEAVLGKKDPIVKNFKKKSLLEMIDFNDQQWLKQSKHLQQYNIYDLVKKNEV